MSMDSLPAGDIAGRLSLHHQKSAKAHAETHEMLEGLEECTEEMDEKLDGLHKAIKHGRDSYKHKSEDNVMINAALAGMGRGGYGCESFLGPLIGGFAGSAVGGLLNRGHHGGGYGYGNGGYGTPCGSNGDYYNALSLDRVQGNEFDIQTKLGDIQKEVMSAAYATTAAVDRNGAALLVAIKDASYANTVATLQSKADIIQNQQDLYIKALERECCERSRIGDRDRTDIQITSIQNQNANQFQLQEERNRYRAEENKYLVANLFSTLANQTSAVQNKSVTIGSGTSGATSTNTQNVA